MTTDNGPERVVIRAAPEVIGTVTGHDGRKRVEVAFDGGGTGVFKPEALMPADEAPMTNKTWPPSDLETKALPG